MSRFSRLGLVLAGLILAGVGCSGVEDPTSKPETTGTIPASPVRTLGPPDTPTPAGSNESNRPTKTASPNTAGPTTPPNTPTPVPDPIKLEVLSPADYAGLEAPFVRVMGTTSGSSISINSLPVGVSEDGGFQRDLPLGDGVNLIEVIASDDTGQTASKQITVFVVADTAGLPFSLIYPPDGSEVYDPRVPLVGLTRPDAVVGVNDVPVEVDGSGLFSAEVDLEEGANLIEVVAADVEGNVRFQTVVVFYSP